MMIEHAEENRRVSLEHAERDKEAHAAIRQSLREQVCLQLPSDIVGRLEARQSTLRSRGLYSR